MHLRGGKSEVVVHDKYSLGLRFEDSGDVLAGLYLIKREDFLGRWQIHKVNFSTSQSFVASGIP